MAQIPDKTPSLIWSTASTVLITACLLLAQLSSRAGEVPAEHKEVPTKHKEVATELKGLLNFHEVHPYLFRGGAPNQASLKDLQEKGVKTLIDLRAPSERLINEEQEASKLGMRYLELPMGPQAPTKKQVDTFIKEVEQAKEGKSGPVFVHCAHGSDRTGCMVGIWRVTHDGYTYDQAYAEMLKYYFGERYKALSGAVRSYSQQVEGQNKAVAQ